MKNYKRYLNYGTWYLFIFLTPVTLIGVLSQNTIPGDFLYPVKRGLEVMVLAASSVNQKSKASYSTYLADTRFSEAQKLLYTKSDTSGLSALVDQTQVAQLAVDQIQDPNAKKVIANNLIASINKYENSLTQAEIQLPAIRTQTSSAISDLNAIVHSSPTPSSSQAETAQTAPLPPSQQNNGNGSYQEQNTDQQALEETKQQLDEAKKELEQIKQSVSQNANVPAQNSSSQNSNQQNNNAPSQSNSPNTNQTVNNPAQDSATHDTNQQGNNSAQQSNPQNTNAAAQTAAPQNISTSPQSSSPSSTQSVQAAPQATAVTQPNPTTSYSNIIVTVMNDQVDPSQGDLKISKGTTVTWYANDIQDAATRYYLKAFDTSNNYTQIFTLTLYKGHTSASYRFTIPHTYQIEFTSQKPDSPSSGEVIEVQE